MKLFWRLLVGAGLLLAVMALGMDTSVETEYGRRVHNIGLQQERLLLLVFGCVLFLAGIVLFAVLKLKQTPEQDEAEKQARSKALAKAKSILEDAPSQPSSPRPRADLPPGSKQVELRGDISDFSRR